jgi:glycosyltransferase involved in cell wall biosynthesis
MRVSVVVPAYNEEKMLSRCLESLKAQTHPCEIVVCDNNSGDRTREMAARHADRVVVEKEPGALHALNTGMRHASGDLIAVTGADCVVPPDWVEKFARRFSDPVMVGCYGPVNSLEGRHSRYFSAMNYVEKACIRTGLWFVIQGANCMLRRDVLEKVGYFDPSVKVFEENGLFRKIKKHGKVRFVTSNPIRASGRRIDECGKVRLVLLGASQMVKLTLTRKTGTSKFKVVR